MRLAGSFVLALLVLGAFHGAFGHGFLELDDPRYVTENPVVLEGWTWRGVRWAFTSFDASNWHPLTWLSHMLDVELFGTDPAGHHATNVVLHGAVAVLLFLALGALGLRALTALAVAALFAVHPLRVESVAWVSERKDLLAGLFWMLSLLAYVAWTRRRDALRTTLLVASFACGLLSKPTVVALPLVLLLLDGWPLGRLWRENLRERVVEKAPLLVLALASAVVTVLAQEAGEAVAPTESLPLAARLANAPVAYVHYLAATFWPTELVFHRPHPALHGGGWSPLRVAASTLLVLGLTVAAVRLATRRPWVTVGWAWFLVVLVPMIGLVQVGGQAWADRYTYLPQIGLLLLVAREVEEEVRRGKLPARLAGGLALVLPLVLGLVTWRQTGRWRSGESLARYTLSVDPGNWRAEVLLAQTLRREGRDAEALAAWRRAAELAPDEPGVRYSLANTQADTGDREGAEREYRLVLELDPTHARAHYNLAALLRDRRALEEAADQFRAAAEGFGEARELAARARLELANTLLLLRRPEDALQALEDALSADPGLEEARALREQVRAFLGAGAGPGPG